MNEKQEQAIKRTEPRELTNNEVRGQYLRAVKRLSNDNKRRARRQSFDGRCFAVFVFAVLMILLAVSQW